MFSFGENVKLFRSGLYQTLSSVVTTPDLMLLVDPCWLPDELAAIRAFVDHERNGRPLFLLFTHGDFDHVLGAGMFPDAETIAHQALAAHPDPAGVLRMIHEFDAKYYIERQHPVVFPTITRPMPGDGETLAIGSTTLTFHASPGHTADGLFTLVEPEGVLFAGDYLSDFEKPFIYVSGRQYEATLMLAERLVESGRIRLLVPGHGRPTRDRGEMLRRIRVSREHVLRLREAIRTADETTLSRLEAEHAFPSDFTRGCHQMNVTIIRREEGLETNENAAKVNTTP